MQLCCKADSSSTVAQAASLARASGGCRGPLWNAVGYSIVHAGWCLCGHIPTVSHDQNADPARTRAFRNALSAARQGLRNCSMDHIDGNSQPNLSDSGHIDPKCEHVPVRSTYVTTPVPTKLRQYQDSIEQGRRRNVRSTYLGICYLIPLMLHVFSR